METLKSNIGLDKSSKKYNCPSCKHKTFVRMKNFLTGELFPDEVGRCDREDNCGYHLTAKQYFAIHPLQNIEIQKSDVPVQCQTVDYLPMELLEKSVLDHKKCNLYPFLKKLFTPQITAWLCLDYFIGTSKDGNTVFWQVDALGRVRQAKVMQYDPETGRRNKDTGAFFAGKKILNNNEANLQQCFFGEYLLTKEENENKPIAIFESEKTAAIVSIYCPEYVCLATGGKHGAKWTESSVCKVLKGHNVVLYPDLGAYDSWKSKGLLLAAVAGCRVSVSEVLEKIATDEDRANGLDLADYLLREKDSSGLALTDGPYPVIWDLKHTLINN